MKQLTQAVFDGAPDWVKSADLLSSGHGFYRSVSKDRMQVVGMYRDLKHKDDAEDYKSQMIGRGYFDNTDWQNSAIDREVSK